ncbi:MAG TPA: carbohydrate ABC transporter permease [Candidatus Pullilachnospira intestinigallinarum]|nr:carbohydrate ABC transporter permease [Candidatus Pullilachnospira intestinigallinarum]
MRHGKRRYLKSLTSYMILIIGAVIMLVPFVWMVLTSFKTYAETVKVPIQWLPAVWSWDNYREVLMRLDFIRYYGNTIIVTVLTTVLMLFIGSLSAFAFARMNFPFKNALFYMLLTVFMVPAQMTMIPKYLIISNLGWVDSLKALVIPNLFSVYTMFMLRQFFAALPRELEDAGKIDGCSYFRLYWNIEMPLCKSSVVAITVLNVLWCWNDLLWPLIATSSDKMRVLSVAMATLQGQHGTQYQLLMAAGVLAIIPMIIIYIFGQRYFIEGIAFTGVKG